MSICILLKKWHSCTFKVRILAKTNPNHVSIYQKVQFFLQGTDPIEIRAIVIDCARLCFARPTVKNIFIYMKIVKKY